MAVLLRGLRWKLGKPSYHQTAAFVRKYHLDDAPTIGTEPDRNGPQFQVRMMSVSQM